MSSPAARTLLLLRHAKSAYPDGVEDHDRPLSERGERDAQAVAARLGEPPDVVLCSTAARARRTWDIVEAELDRAVTVRYEPDLYLASARAMLGLVRGTGAGVQRLLVVAHNPGTQELAVELAGRAPGAARRRLREKFPTAALAVFSIEGPWRDADTGTARLMDFIVPRE